jgi:hypothetical protein
VGWRAPIRISRSETETENFKNGNCVEKINCVDWNKNVKTESIVQTKLKMSKQNQFCRLLSTNNPCYIIHWQTGTLAEEHVTLLILVIILADDGGARTAGSPRLIPRWHSPSSSNTCAPDSPSPDSMGAALASGESPTLRRRRRFTLQRPQRVTLRQRRRFTGRRPSESPCGVRGAGVSLAGGVDTKGRLVPG